MTSSAWKSAGSGGQHGRLLSSFAEDVAQILDRCGYEVFSAEPGDPFLRERHRPLAVVPCDDESGHNTVAEVVAAGFVERDTGRVRRPLHARFHQYSPERGETGKPPAKRTHSEATWLPTELTWAPPTPASRTWTRRDGRSF